jgi:hypothetical protein
MVERFDEFGEDAAKKYGFTISRSYRNEKPGKMLDEHAGRV